MSASVFYVIAILVIVAALVGVGAPSTRLALLGVMASDVLVGILLIAAGAQLLGGVVVIMPTVCLLATAILLRRSGYGSLLADLPPFTRRWPAAAAVSVALGVLLVWTANTGADDRVSGGDHASLITLLHYRFPVALAVAAGLAAVSIGGALLIGRTGADERRLDQAAAHRRLREQRALARRQQRTEARARRGEPKASA